MTAISDKYASLGGVGSSLGAPVTAELNCPDHIGHYQHYANDASIYWSPSTGAHLVYGLIRQKWAKLGWEKSALGYPTSDETDSPSGRGRYNGFQGGAILWRRGDAEAFESHGAIRAKWGDHGYENGLIGFPMTDETKTPDLVGRYNHFEHGSIYWKPSIGAHEVHGAIRTTWAANGWERNANLGYPISDETPHNGANRFSDFENGVLYWRAAASTTAMLSPTSLFDASRTRDEVQADLAKRIGDQLKAANGRVYMEDGPRITGVTDYSPGDGGVLNRQYMVYTKIGYDVSGLPDPDSEITLNVLVRLDRGMAAVTATITSWHVHSHVPFPTSLGKSASSINAELKPHLDAVLWKPTVVQQLSADQMKFIVALKIMPNGDLNTYLQI